MCLSKEVVIKYRGLTGQIFPENESLYQCTSVSKTKPQIISCNKCFHVFSDRSTWPNESANEYAHVSDPRYLDLERAKNRTFKRAADLTSELFDQPKNLIEIGSYTGIFLAIMAQRGWSAIGIEPSRWAAEISRKKNLEIVPLPFEEAISSQILSKADLVVSWDVLEHVKDPRFFISTMSGLTKDGGYFVFSTLDRSNFFAKITGKHWPWIIPMHLHYFEKKSLIEIVSGYGFKFIKTSPHVHYANLEYILRKLIPYNLGTMNLSFLRKFIIPVGFGDVRYFIFRKEKFNE